ncbi:MAG: Gfo/Idh/MocA family oxidoreductase, partial [Chthoniobacterales bacterium]
MANSVLSEVGSGKNGFRVKNKIVRVGIAGLGRSGWFNHVLTIEEIPEHFTVVAVTDPNAERCKEVSEKFKCRTHADLDSLLADEDVDVVVLA